MSDPTALDAHVPVVPAPRAPIHDALQRERAGRDAAAYVRTQLAAYAPPEPRARDARGRFVRRES